MININFDPILFHVGGLTITWHGLLLGAGILATYSSFRFLGKKRGLPVYALAELPVFLIIVGFIGARLFSVAGDWKYYEQNPVMILAVSLGGLTVTGGILSGLLVVILYAHFRHLSSWTLLDILAFAILFGDIVGRAGCLILGDVWGVPTGHAWGIIYWHPGADIPDRLLGIPTFPAPIAFQVWDFAILVILWISNQRSHPTGSLFTTFLGLYGFERAVIAIWQSEQSIWLGIKFIQMIGIIMIVIALVMRLIISFRQNSRVYPNNLFRQPE